MMVRLIIGSVGRYDGGDSLPLTVWEGRRFGPFGELTWAGPTLLFVLSSVGAIVRHFQMLKAPNYFIGVAMLSCIVAVAMCGLRIWALPSRPAKGRYRATGLMAEKLKGLGEVWLTDEPELNPKRVGKSIVLHEHVAESLTREQIEAVVYRLRNLSLWYQTAGIVAEAFHPATLFVWVGFLPKIENIAVAFGWIMLILIVFMGVTMFKYRIPTLILAKEGRINPQQRESLAEAMEAIFKLAKLEPNKFTQSRIDNLRVEPS